jgi:GNAT superfamily N-acetyltransferase
VRRCFPTPTGKMPELISPALQHTIEIEKIKYVIGLIGSPRYYILAHKVDILIGFAILSESTLQYFYDLSWVCVDLPYRKQGIGHRIVREAIQFSQTQDRSLIISTDQPNFYADLNFKNCMEYRPGWYLMATTKGHSI